MTRDTKLKLLMPIFYTIVAGVFFILSWPPQPQGHHYFGVIITAISFILWITSRIQLGNAFSLVPKSKYLVKTGIYSKLRHPVYYFSITAIIGISVYIWQPWVLIPLALLLILEVVRIQKEEALLKHTFGKEYTTYKQNSWF